MDNQWGAYLTIVLSAVIGGGSLLLFGAFLILGPFAIIRFNAAEPQALVRDGFLSLLFFLQHSGMIRTCFGKRLSSVIPSCYHPAIYAIASGIVLTGVVLFWQTGATVIFQIHGPLHLLMRTVTLLGIIGFMWGVRALKAFDTFGWDPIVAKLHGKPPRTADFVIRGPYLWVRHPLYFFTLVLIWSAPCVHSDRFLFNVLWSFWIVFGAHLEEKNLVAAFGDTYRHYRKSVPMLLPWRGPAGKRM